MLAARGSPARRWLGTALCALALAMPVRAQAPMRVVYPAAESNADARQSYPKAVLAMALEHAGHPFLLQPSPVSANQQRALRLLASGGGLDVAWSVATDVRERQLRGIPVAIDRGMFGWRVLLIRRGTEARFAQVGDVAQLADLHGAQGADWPDLAVLRAAGLQVHGVQTYDGLFEMLARGRLDYVPRSVLEVSDELARRPRQGLAIEPHLLLRYPSALHFYVDRRNTALAAALETGLAKAEADGCLDRLFNATFGEVLAPLRLKDRSVIPLPNTGWTPPPRSAR